MTLYALINRDLTDTGERRRFDVAPPGPADLAPGKPYYVPVVEEVSDDSTGSAPTVTEPWVETAEADRLLRSRTIRDKTAAELDAMDDSTADRAFSGVGRIERALGRALFDHENRLRALEGRPAVTAGQFKTALKGLLR